MAYRANILISSAAPGAPEVEQALLDRIEELHLASEVQVIQAATLSPQPQGVELVIYPEGTHYVRLTPEDARRELRGLDLGCWCREGATCHGETLLAAANR